MLGKVKKMTAGPDDLKSRQAVLWMHPQAIVALMISQRWVIVENHLPQDAQFGNVFWDPMRNVWGLVVLSKEFKPIMAGAEMPQLPAINFRYYNPAKDGVIE